MSTMRPELSKRNKYWIDKHRYYELKYFCLQYDRWKKGCAINYLHACDASELITQSRQSDIVGNCATRLAQNSYRAELIETTAKEADPYLGWYIFKAVTEGLSFTYLNTVLEIPCGKDMYYDRYHRFFWLLDQKRL